MKNYILFIVLIIMLLSSCAPTDVALTPPPKIDPGVNPAEWALVPAGEFYMGVLQEYPWYPPYMGGSTSPNRSTITGNFSGK